MKYKLKKINTKEPSCTTTRWHIGPETVDSWRPSSGRKVCEQHFSIFCRSQIRRKNTAVLRISLIARKYNARFSTLEFMEQSFLFRIHNNLSAQIKRQTI
jgi:hypothetical protein